MFQQMKESGVHLLRLYWMCLMNQRIFLYMTIMKGYMHSLKEKSYFGLKLYEKVC